MKKILALVVLLAFPAFALGATYTDVPATARYYDAVEALSSQGVLEGYSDGSFRPLAEVQRDEFLKMLLTTDDQEPKVADYSSCFPDVQKQWFAPFVCFAKANNILGGYPDGYFRPAKNINLAEGVKLALETFELTNPSCQTILSGNADAWYAPYLCEAYNLGLITSQQYLQPAKNLTRGESANLLYLTQKINTPATSEDENTTATETPTPEAENETPEVIENENPTPPETNYPNQVLENTTTPLDNVLVTGSQRVLLLDTRFSGKLENVYLEKLGYQISGQNNTFLKFYVVYQNSPETSYYLEGTPNSGQIVFNFANKERPFINRDKETSVKLYADIVETNSASLGTINSVSLDANNFQGRGQWSQDTYSYGALDVRGDTQSEDFTLSSGFLNFQVASNSPSGSHVASIGDTLMIASVTNQSNNTSRVTALGVTLSGSLIQNGSTPITLKIYNNQAYSDSSLIAEVSAVASQNGSLNFGTITNFQRPFEVGASSTAELYFVVDTTQGSCESDAWGFCAFGGDDTLQLGITNYAFENRGAIIDTSTQSLGITLPVYGEVLIY